MPAYAELHCASAFSFQRGAAQPAELVERAHAMGYAALALTDECSLAGVVRAFEAAKRLDFPLIVGAEMRLDDGPRLVLLVADAAGYRDLCALITRARRRSAKGGYRLHAADLAGHAGHLLALWLPEPHTEPSDARNLSHGRWLQRHFPGRCWIAVHQHRLADDARRAQQARTLSAALGMPITAAGGAVMATRSGKPLADVMTALRLRKPLPACGRQLAANAEAHLRPLATLTSLYPAEWLAESTRIARRCRFRLDALRYTYPRELVPAGRTASEHLRALTEAGMARRWPQGTPPAVRRQIERELGLIAELGYEHFFLTVEDIVAFARGRGILCQGRGSAANSAVCFALGITEVDPARGNLLFERFVSKERDEPPDIDVDFEHQRREEVIQYVYDKYGRSRAALAATVICYRPKSALRDAGFALGIDPATVDRLAKALLWRSRNGSTDERLRALGVDPEAPAIRRWLDVAEAMVGLPRHLSQHVGGFVIAEEPLHHLVPVENAAMADRTIIQWDKDDLETLGLLKVDLLALGMLSAIRRALAMVSARRAAPFRLSDIPAEDAATYAMISKGETLGVFQIESRAQMSMLPRLKPHCFYDLVIEVAIIRPGPIQGGMVHPYLKRRQGLEPVDYPSEALKKVLERTLGVPLFQEQVMQIAIVAAGFSPGEADQVRRSMAAWKRSGGLEHFRDRLLAGMRQRGYDPAFAEAIYQQILGFGSYGFPESHAASFALLAYASAWLKCHEPAAFFAALLNSQPMGFYAPAQLVAEARRMGVTVRPVDVRFSDWDCTLEDTAWDDGCAAPAPATAAAGSPDAKHADAGHGNAAQAIHRQDAAAPRAGAGCAVDASAAGSGGPTVPVVAQGGQGVAWPAQDVCAPQPALRLGLRQIGGLSEAAAARIVAARSQRAFSGLYDLVHRAGLDARDRAALAAADALASLTGHRHQAHWQAAGAQRLPGLLAGHGAREAPLALPAPREGQEILADYAATGLSLRRHPVALLRPRLDRMGVCRRDRVEQLPDGCALRVAGLAINRQRPGTARGTIFMTLEDEDGCYNLILWADVFERFRQAALGDFLVVRGKLQRAEGVTHIVAHHLRDCSAWVGGLAVVSRNFQ